MKKIKDILIFIILTYFATGYVSFSFEEEENTIEIYTSLDLNIGDVPVGTKKHFDYEEQVITFVIKCKQNRLIRITKINEIGNDMVIIDAEWKVGPYTGLEFKFDDIGVFRSEQDLFLVKIKIKSVEVKKFALSGKYEISPKIAVEYADL
ncbi:MAG: hypothetical protein M9949_11270 [Candidatus Kapabacteria bacterium]|nr:hypothetical protein [Candidatus Kapabacteria bacterium]